MLLLLLYYCYYYYYIIVIIIILLVLYYYYIIVIIIIIIIVIIYIYYLDICCITLIYYLYTFQTSSNQKLAGHLRLAIRTHRWQATRCRTTSMPLSLDVFQGLIKDGSFFKVTAAKLMLSFWGNVTPLNGLPDMVEEFELSRKTGFRGMNQNPIIWRDEHPFTNKILWCKLPGRLTWPTKPALFFQKNMEKNVQHEELTVNHSKCYGTCPTLTNVFSV